MFQLRRGTIRLFSVSGIEVFLHWSWFLVAAFEISDRTRSYSSPVWNILEYLTLFLIVMLHEFGHALACRQVGGTANRIVLWPLGGVAYVNPPMRPGAVLWSIVAGPLVNVALLPVLAVLVALGRSMGWAQDMPNAYAFLRTVLAIDLGLLVFNVLPIYPLDGGKILWSLLWFVMGRARSLMVATVVGFLGAAGLVVSGVHLRLDLAGNLVPVPGAELLDRAASGAEVVATGKFATARGICMPVVQSVAADRGLLGVSQVQDEIRHVCDERRLPFLRGCLRHHEMSGLRTEQSFGSVGGRLGGNVNGFGTVGALVRTTPPRINTQEGTVDGSRIRAGRARTGKADPSAARCGERVGMTFGGDGRPRRTGPKGCNRVYNAAYWGVPKRNIGFEVRAIRVIILEAGNEK